MNRGLNVKDPKLIYFGIYFYMRKSVEYAYSTVDGDWSRCTVRVGGDNTTSRRRHVLEHWRGGNKRETAGVFIVHRRGGMARTVWSVVVHLRLMKRQW
jgi:hypothetical protein